MTHEIVIGLLVTTLLGYLILWRTKRSDDPSSWILRFGWLGRVAGSMGFLGLELAGIYSMGGLNRYHPFGSQIAEAWRHLEIPDIPFQVGTTSISYLTGIIYTITSPSVYAGFIVYATLGFLGSYLFYKAFCLAFPDGNNRRYCYLIFFYPSLLFWSSSMGKDAPMFLLLGLFAYMTALLHRRGIRLTYLVLLAMSIVAIQVVRNNMAVVTTLGIAAFGVMSILSRSNWNRITRVGIVILLGIMTLVLLSYVADRLHIKLTLSSVLDYIELRQRHTGYGGSAFEPPSPRTIGGLLMAFPTVILRPFPWEAHNIYAMVASLESLLLIILLVRHWRSLCSVVNVKIDPYIWFLIAYVISFVLVFMTVANFGLMVRQRAQLLPFLFMMASLHNEGWFSQQVEEKIADL